MKMKYDCASGNPPHHKELHERIDVIEDVVESAYALVMGPKPWSEVREELARMLRDATGRD